MRLRLVSVFLMLILGACAGTDEAPPEAEPAESAAETEEGAASQADPKLAKICEDAFELIDSNEPGTVPRKEATKLANEAFFVDDSVQVTSAFSNLNNVYVYDDGTSSEAEVRAQLDDICI